jgi:hypothetical protein
LRRRLLVLNARPSSPAARWPRWNNDKLAAETESAQQTLVWLGRLLS